MTRSTCAWCHVSIPLLEQPLGRTGCCSIDCAAKLAARIAADRLESELASVGAEHVPDPDWQEKTWKRIDAQDRRRAFAWVAVPLVLAIVVAIILLLSGCSPTPQAARCAPCPDPGVDWLDRGFAALTGASVLALVLEVRGWIRDHLWWGGGGGGRGGGL